jgi:hypothetical protein
MYIHFLPLDMFFKRGNSWPGIIFICPERLSYLEEADRRLMTGIQSITQVLTACLFCLFNIIRSWRDYTVSVNRWSIGKDEEGTSDPGKGLGTTMNNLSCHVPRTWNSHADWDGM